VEKFKSQNWRVSLIWLTLLLGLLVTLSLSFYRQVHELGAAGAGNTQWSLAQFETEYLRYALSLSPDENNPVIDPDKIRLRFDIFVSRFFLTQNGEIGTLTQDDPKFIPSRQAITAFIQDSDQILESDDSTLVQNADILRNLTHDVKKSIHEFSLLGVQVVARSTTTSRLEIKRQLGVTSGAVIVLLAAFLAVLIGMRRLYQKTKISDQLLQDTSQFLTSTVEASLDGIIIADEANTIVEFNAAAEEIFGWTRAEITGKHLTETIIPQHLRLAHLEGMKHSLATGETRLMSGGRVILSALRKSGEEFPVEINVTRVSDHRGIHFIAYLRDISSRVENERRLTDARDQAEYANRSKSRFVAMVSHEMRTPLNGMLGVLDLLRNTAQSDAQRDYVDLATSSGELLLGHINNALDITRMETIDHPLSQEGFHPLTLVTKTITALTPLAQEKNIQIALETSGDTACWMHSDAEAIRQIVTNLLGNAIKFTQGGQIELALDVVHKGGKAKLHISVCDNGPGIAPDRLEEIFQDYTVLAQPEGRQSHSHGLGLAISRRLTHLMSGDLKVASTPGEGSCFTLEVTLDLAPQAENPDVSASNIDAASPPLPPLKILVAEDNPINLQVLCDMLHYLGQDFTTAANGADALARATEVQFDLILMDINMPVMNGIEAIRLIRAGTTLNTHSRIIALSAQSSADYSFEELTQLCEFEAKPLRLTRLRELLQSCFVKDQSDEISSTVLTELQSILGDKKTEDALEKFFEELNSLQNSQNHTDHEDLKQQAHKAAGAAALLGLTGLSNLLGQMSKFTGVQPLDLLMDQLDSLAQKTRILLQDQDFLPKAN